MDAPKAEAAEKVRLPASKAAPLTWAEFKAALESAGVTDEMGVLYMDFNSLSMRLGLRLVMGNGYFYVY